MAPLTRSIAVAPIVMACALLAQTPLASADAPGEGLVSAEAKRHVAEARRIAGDDLKAQVAAMCHKPEPARVAGAPPAPGTVVPPPKPRPVLAAYAPNRIFDNVWYFGSREVGSTVIRTSAGLVLIDTLTTAEDAKRILVDGMTAQGLKVADIRYVILTHAHGDHHGGVALLRQLNPRFKVVMSADDWAFSKKPYYMSDGNPDAAPKPPQSAADIAYKGRYALKVGGTTFDILETPGHTPVRRACCTT